MNISTARLDIHRAAAELSDRDALILAAIVARGPFDRLLGHQRARAAELCEAPGTTLHVPATTADAWADAELLGALRAVAKAAGIELPPVGSVGR